MSNILAKGLKFLREKKGLQQKELAEELNINYSTYKNWEQGKSEPNIEMLCQIAEYFNTSTDYILGIKTNTENKAREQKAKKFQEKMTRSEKALREELQGLDDFQISYVRGVVSELQRQNNFKKQNKRNI